MHLYLMLAYLSPNAMTYVDRGKCGSSVFQRAVVISSKDVGAHSMVIA
jgi:hypothetical protein